MTRRIVRFVLAASLAGGFGALALSGMRAPNGAGTSPRITGAASARPTTRAGRHVVARIAASPLPALACLTAILIGFGVWYTIVLTRIEVFGDAAEHARIARAIMEDGVWAADTRYPSLYHLLVAPFLAVSGDNGMQIFTALALLLLGIAVYALALELTSSRLCALASVWLALIAPQTMFYAGRMYMEVFLSALFVFATVFLSRYLRREAARDLIACAIFCGLAAATKQQGLLLVASVGLVLAMRTFSMHRKVPRIERRTVASLAAFVAIVLGLAIPSYVGVMRAQGAILPDTEYTAWANTTARAVTGLEVQTSDWQVRWNDRLDASFAEAGGQRGFALAEQRHVWPWDVFTTQRGFWGIHTLYYGPSPAWRYSEALTQALFVLFAAGLAVWAWQWRLRPFAWYLLLFLALNYATFIRNNDQSRYHLYLAFMFAFAAPFAITALGRAHTRARPLALAAFATLAAVAGAVTAADVPDRFELVAASPRLQAYAPSSGGITSIRETGLWLNAQLGEDETFYAVPSNEFAYYAGRRGIFDYRLYFLRGDELANVIDDSGVRYIVIPDSAVQPDDAWNNVVKAPQSFASEVSSLYPAVYAPAARDVVVYDARPATPPGPRAFAAGWLSHDAPAQIAAGSQSVLTVSVKNDGTLVWPRASALRLAHHWNYGACPGDQRDHRSIWDGPRSSFPTNVAPGDSVAGVKLRLEAPTAPGAYCLVFDIVWEGVGWFSRLGTHAGSAQTVLVR